MICCKCSVKTDKYQELEHFELKSSHEADNFNRKNSKNKHQILQLVVN